MSFLRMISTPETYEAARAHFEELAFQRQANQGELQAPRIITDGQPALRNMVDGKVYDSKSAMRKVYRENGVTEVGSEKVKPYDRSLDREARAKHREKIKGALYKAHSQMGYGAP